MALGRFYRVSEVKDALGICEKTIYKEIRDGRLVAEYVGPRRQVRISESAVLAYLALNKVEATGAEGEATGAELIPSEEEQQPKARKPRAAKRAGRPRKGVAV